MEKQIVESCLLLEIQSLFYLFDKAMDIDFEEKKLYYHYYYELRFNWYSVDELTNAYAIWIDCTQYGIYISY